MSKTIPDTIEVKPFSILTRVKGRLERTASFNLFRRPFQIPNKTAYVSFTFDDFPTSALHVGGAILREHGMAGTYYASLGLMGTQAPTGEIFQEKDLETLFEQGHELGCHTFSHAHSWETKPAAFEESVLANREAVGRMVPGHQFRTFSYPISCPRPFSKRRIQRYFTGCRGGGQTFNQGVVDLNYLSAFFIEKSRDDVRAIQSVIDASASANGWLILATHDLAAQPTPYGCTPDVFEKVVRHVAASGALVKPVAEVLQCMDAPRFGGGSRA